MAICVTSVDRACIRQDNFLKWISAIKQRFNNFWKNLEIEMFVLYLSVFAGVIDDSKLDVDFLYFFIIWDYQSYLIEENNTNDKTILELVHRKLSGVPLLEICRVAIL